MRERTRSERRKGRVVGTASNVVAETLGGILLSASAEVNLKNFEQYIRQFGIWPFDIAAARVYAALYADLRPRGICIQAHDLMITSIALALGNCTVVTQESDFNRIPGLRVENWLT